MISALRIGRAKWVTGFLALIGMIAASATAQTAPQASMSRNDLVKALQDGGLIMFMRHERTEVPSRSDDYSAPAECRKQRNLSLAGAAGAQETGVVLRAVGIEVDRIITSPMCRAAETARFMFGARYETDMRLMHHDPNGERNMDIATSEARDLLADLDPIELGGNVMLIGHGGTVRRISGLSLSEGGIAILRLSEGDEVITLGHFMGSDLAPLARQNLQIRE